MGRTFENRKNAMLKRGARDSKAFTRCGRQISMAVKAGGPDPDGNPSLRQALQNARAANMPKDKINNAIAKAAGQNDTSDFQQILYEGFGPHGVALLVETATDNPTRTVANIRHAFKKESGSLGSSGSVSFMFDHCGIFRLTPDSLDRDELEMELIDDGLEEMLDGTSDKDEPLLLLRCTRENFGNLQSGLDTRKIEVVSSGFEWVPKNTTELPEEQLDEVLKLIGRLEEDDDVQEVFHNLD